MTCGFSKFCQEPFLKICHLGGAMRYFILFVGLFFILNRANAQGYLRDDNITTYTSGVTINEVCANGSAFDYNADGSTSSSYDKDEFIEIVNNSDQTIDIGGWTLADNSTAYFVFPDPTYIAPGKAVVVFTAGADVTNFNPGAGNLVLSAPSGFRLSNSDDAVGLKNNDGLYITVKWGNGTLTADFTTGATLVGSEVTLSDSWVAGQSQSRNPDYTGSWDFHPTITGTVNWSVDHTVTLTDPQASPGRKYGLDQSLPVTLSSFGATVSNNAVLLQWRTESEVDNLGFEIYRSLSEEEGYQLLSSYLTNPDLKGQLNSSVGKTYRYSDYTVQNGQTYYYKLADVSLTGHRTFHGPIKILAVNDQTITGGTSVPQHFKLYPNVPNPFNPATQIVFDVPKRTGEAVTVQLEIFDIRGQKIRTLLNRSLPEGKQYRLNWDGKDRLGNAVPAGIYFAVLNAGSFRQSIKMCLVR